MEEKKTTNNEKIKIKLRTLIIIGSIVLVIIISLIVGYFLYRNEINNQNDWHTRRTNEYRKNNNSNGEFDLSMFEGLGVDKPIIYLYPTEKVELSVKLGYPQKVSCSYPKYIDGWNIIANPDGTLIDKDTERKLYSLYWEGIRTESIEFKDGFVVKGEDTISFLEEKLAILGLNEYEAEEFIVYWLPKIQDNKYNLIRFATMEEINKNMPLEFSAEPDTLIRILMQFKAVDSYIDIPEQQLETPERNGFVVVEWGGTEVK